LSDAAIVAYLAVLGVAVGSFLNVAIDRLPRGESLVYGKSHCDNCGRRIALYDLTPLLAYLWLVGRCRYCRTKIPMRVPVVEATAGTLFGVAAYLYGFNLETLVVIVNISVLLVVFFIDLEHKLIFPLVIFSGLLFAFASFPWGPIGREYSTGEAFVRSLSGAGTGLLVMGAIYYAGRLVWRREAIGFGDVELALLMGAALGFPHILAAFLITAIVGGLAAIGLILFKGMKRQDIIPYGPFLAASAILLLLARDNAYGWYLDLLGR
jgi:leader peptidase (prepilin peptidase)/N-methyltransferase